MRTITRKALIFATVLSVAITSIAWAGAISDKNNTETQSTTTANAKESETASTKVTVKTPSLRKSLVNGKGYLTWKKNNKADRVEIWYSTSRNGKYIKKAETGTGRHLISRFDKGSLFYVKLRAYRTVNGKIYRGSFSNTVTVVSGVKITKVTSPAAGAVTVKWEKLGTASGYILQYSTDKNFEKAVKSVRITKKSQTSKKLYELSQNKKYYFRICSYKLFEGNKRNHSYWSKPVSVNVTSASNIINGDYKNTNGFFEDSVFFGDSVLQGFGIYVNNKERGYLDGTKVMGVVSYSLIAALKPTSDYHPLFRGKHTSPQDITKALGAKKVFLFFGINDVLNTGNPKYCLENYKQLVTNIKDKNPDVKVYIISTTYSLKGSKDYVNYTKNLHTFNELLRDYCAKSDCEFIDVASYLSTGDGYLNPDLCSDGFVHQTINAYTIWDKVLRYYAWSQTKK